MSRMLTQSQLAELEVVRQMNGGVLTKEAVIDFARSSNTALHAAFTWDADDAQAKLLLIEAGRVIRAAVTMLPRPDDALVPVRAYVTVARNTYRTITAVLQDEDDMEVLLRRMRLDVDRVLERYRRYASLAPHIEAAMGALVEGPTQAAPG